MWAGFYSLGDYYLLKAESAPWSERANDLEIRFKLHTIGT
jgi:hypothetical protein